VDKSICNHCYKEIDAEVVKSHDGVWLKKCCPEHGNFLELIEPDVAFYESIENQRDDTRLLEYINTTGLDVTDRCNVRCPHCYALPEDDGKDISIDKLIEISKLSTKGSSFILMGAEPSMRNDLAELCDAIRKDSGKPVGIYTNAIRFADKKYVNKTIENIDFFNISLHTRDYLPNPKLFDMKLKGIENIKSAGKSIYHISFSLLTIDHLDEVLEHIENLKGAAHHFRIRTPSRVGTCETPPMFLSELYNEFVKRMNAKGHEVKIVKSDNGPYHLNVKANGTLFRLVHFPSVHNVQIKYLQRPTWALFVPEIGETNLVHQFIIQEGLKTNKVEQTVRFIK
jgi:organic radical activating enzyme